MLTLVLVTFSCAVQEALDRLGDKRTVLVIAHRLGTIKHGE